MKALLLLLLFFSFTKHTIAAPYMGGEITWRCIPSGQPNAGKFVFSLKLYSNCNSIYYSTSLLIKSNSPVNHIITHLKSGWPKDISPVCNSNAFIGTGTNIISCSNSSSIYSGAAKIYLYESLPINIQGVPPTNGWTFYFNSCCRNPSTNLNGVSGVPYFLRSKMYANNGQNTFPCFDSSPKFASEIQTIYNTSYPNSIMNFAYDKDQDSLTYEWGEAMATTIFPINYNPNYSYPNPLPGLFQDSNNIPAVLDTTNGMINFTSFTSGSFITTVKVSSFKNGNLCAEIWRESIVIIREDSGINQQPAITPPLQNETSFSDTISVGKIVSFDLSTQSIQFLPNGDLKTITINAFSNQFGDYIPAIGTNQSTLSTTIGCIKPPCATLTPAPTDTLPISAYFGALVNFNWQTSYAHLDTNSQGQYIPTKYHFIIEAKDDYCPAPEITHDIITLTLIPELLRTPKIKTINVDDNGSVTIKWNPIFIDSNNIFNAYQIYTADSINGDFILLDSIMDKTIGSYTHNANISPHDTKYYYLKINYINDAYNNMLPPYIVRNIVLNTQKISPCITKLSWQSISITESTSYRIFRKTTDYNWTLIKTTNELFYTDNSDLPNAEYKVLGSNINLINSAGNYYTSYSASNIKSINSELSIGNDTIICNNESISLQSSNNYNSYIWSTGNTQNTIILNANNLGIGAHDIWLKASMSYNCESTDSMVLLVEDCTSIADNNNKYNFSVSPNPNNGVFIIKMNSKTNESIEIEVINLIGKTVFFKRYKNNNSIRIDISNQAAGTYVLKLKGKYDVYQKTITKK